LKRIAKRSGAILTGSQSLRRSRGALACQGLWAEQIEEDREVELSNPDGVTKPPAHKVQAVFLLLGASSLFDKVKRLSKNNPDFDSSKEFAHSVYFL